MLLDHDGYLPTYAYISNGKKHDVAIARKVPLSPYSIVTMDRGYSDHSLYHISDDETYTLLNISAGLLGSTQAGPSWIEDWV